MAAAVIANVTTRCDAPNCIPTTMESRSAVKVSVSRGGVLEARLTAEESALPGKPVTAWVFDDDESLYREDASTDADGRLRIDLKKLNTGALTGLARGDRWEAVFAGDADYCSSADDASFRLLRE